MFYLRIHSLDSTRPQESAAATYASVAAPAADAQRQPFSETLEVEESSEPSPSSSSGSATIIKDDPRIQLIKGIVHLYRKGLHPLPSSHSIADPLPSVGRGTLLLVLAVPDSLSAEDFLHFYGPRADRSSAIRIIRNDAIEDRYSVLVKFDDQTSADNFYFELNGQRFPSTEEFCHILFIDSVEYRSTEIAGTPPAGSTELPTCPVCLERLDQDISGIITTACDHSFQCPCISKWGNSSCSVCHFCQEHSEKPICSDVGCGTSGNLWICVICGFVGCGRYKEGHAIKHWKDTQHCYSIDLETKRVWDYVGDNFVHRLNQSKSDDKLDKSKSRCRSSGENCEILACSEDSGINGAILNSKAEAIVDEYNRLLASQLESQGQYYENLLKEEKEEREKHRSEAVEKAVSLKVQDVQLKIDTIMKETKIVADSNENLIKNQNICRERIKEIEDRERETLRMKDEKIRDLEEQLQDLTVFVKAQKVLDKAGGAGDIQGGTVLPVPAPPPSSSVRTKRSSSKSSRRRN